MKEKLYHQKMSALYLKALWNLALLLGPDKLKVKKNVWKMFLKYLVSVSIETGVVLIYTLSKVEL